MNSPRAARRYASLGLLLLALVVGGCQQPARQAPRAVRPAGNANLVMGNPSGAAAEARAGDNYLLEKPYYALSYNNGKGTPNWVSWRLAAEDIGSAPREDFYPDDELPADFEHVTPSDYTDSGFDRGHLCPHADRSATEEMSRATFAMSNIIPQSPHANRQAWEYLESYCRELAKQGDVLYIVAGPAGQGGEGSEGRAETIGRDRTVTVPAQCWKVILDLPSGTSEDPSKVDGRARLIAVIMPNDMSVGDDWAEYRVSVAEVEKLTGYSFFDRVPSSVMDPLKQRVDTTPVPPRSLPQWE